MSTARWQNIAGSKKFCNLEYSFWRSKNPPVSPDLTPPLIPFLIIFCFKKDYRNICNIMNLKSSYNSFMLFPCITVTRSVMHFPLLSVCKLLTTVLLKRSDSYYCVPCHRERNILNQDLCFLFKKSFNMFFMLS